MIKGEKMKGANGYENALFPMEYMYISQGEHDDGKRYVMDFIGWGKNGRVYQCPMYAPCTIKLVAKRNEANIWESVNKVNYIDGTLDYLTVLCVHDNNYNNYQVGDIKAQGELFSQTGTEGQVTGDHTHFAVAKGKYAGVYTPEGATGSTLKNQYHIYNALGVNNTVLTKPLNYNWREFTPTSNKLKDIIVASHVRAYWGLQI